MGQYSSSLVHTGMGPPGWASLIRLAIGVQYMGQLSFRLWVIWVIGSNWAFNNWVQRPLSTTVSNYHHC